MTNVLTDKHCSNLAHKGAAGNAIAASASMRRFAFRNEEAHVSGFVAREKGSRGQLFQLHVVLRCWHGLLLGVGGLQ